MTSDYKDDRSEYHIKHPFSFEKERDPVVQGFWVKIRCEPCDWQTMVFAADVLPESRLMERFQEAFATQG